MNAAALTKLKQFSVVAISAAATFFPFLTFAVTVSPASVNLDTAGNQGNIVCANDGDNNYTVVTFDKDENEHNSTNCDDTPHYLFNQGGGAEFNSSDVPSAIDYGSTIKVIEITNLGYGLGCATVSQCESNLGYINTFSVSVTAAAQAGCVGSGFSSSGIACSVQNINGQTYGFFGVILSKYYIMLIGFLLLIAVWMIGRRIIQHYF